MKKKNQKWWVAFPLTLLLILSFLVTLPVKSYGATDDSLARIKKSGVLRVGTSADNPPNEFIAMEGGKEKIVGYDIDLVQHIADKLGVKLELTNMKFDGLIVSVQNGDFDLSISGFSPTEERKKVVDFSEPYFELPVVLLTTKDKNDDLKSLADLDGKEVAALKGSTQESALKEYIPNAEPVSLGKVPEVIAEVNAGTVEAAVVELPVAESYLKSYPNLVVSDLDIGVPEDETAQVIVFPKGSDTLVTEVNKIIEEVKASGELDKMLEKNKELANAGTGEQSLSSFAPYFVQGAITTIIVALICVIFGTILGLIVGILRLSKNKIISGIAYIYIQVLRGTPSLLQVFVFYFGLSAILHIPSIQFFGINVARLIPGCIALSINSSAYVAEIIRSGINAVDIGQTEAGYSLGLNPRITMKEIILPQAIKNILPALGNEFVTMIKETSLLSVIAVSELMFVADTVKAATFDAMPPLLVAGAIYFVITFTVSGCVSLVEKKLAKSTKF